MSSSKHTLTAVLVMEVCYRQAGDSLTPPGYRMANMRGAPLYPVPLWVNNPVQTALQITLRMG